MMKLNELKYKLLFIENKTKKTTKTLILLNGRQSDDREKIEREIFISDDDDDT